MNYDIFSHLLSLISACEDNLTVIRTQITIQSPTINQYYILQKRLDDLDVRLNRTISDLDKKE